MLQGILAELGLELWSPTNKYKVGSVWVQETDWGVGFKEGATESMLAPWRSETLTFCPSERQWAAEF